MKQPTYSNKNSTRKWNLSLHLTYSHRVIRCFLNTHTQIYSYSHTEVQTLSISFSPSQTHTRSSTNSLSIYLSLPPTQRCTHASIHTRTHAQPHSSSGGGNKVLGAQGAKKNTFRRRKKPETETFRVSVKIGIRRRENFGSEKSWLEIKQKLFRRRHFSIRQRSNKSFFGLIEKRSRKEKRGKDCCDSFSDKMSSLTKSWLEMELWITVEISRRN